MPVRRGRVTSQSGRRGRASSISCSATGVVARFRARGPASWGTVHGWEATPYTRARTPGNVPAPRRSLTPVSDLGDGGEPTTVGIDIGTTSVKAVAVDADGAVLARARMPHGVRSPTPGAFEHDVDLAWRANVLGALSLVAGRRRVAAVNVSAMVPSLGAVDAEGKAVGPGLLYGDRRGARGRRRPDRGRRRRRAARLPPLADASRRRTRPGTGRPRPSPTTPSPGGASSTRPPP